MHRQMSRKGEERYLLVHRHISGGGSCYQLAQHCSCGAIQFVILLNDKQGLLITGVNASIPSFSGTSAAVHAQH